MQESSLLQSMESLQEKLHRSEARVLELQTEVERKKMQNEAERRKLADQHEELTLKYASDIAASNRELELLAKAKEKEVAELLLSVERLKEGQAELQKRLEQNDAKEGEGPPNQRAEIIENLRKLSKASLSDKSDECDRQPPIGLISEIEEIRVLEDSDNFTFDNWATSANTRAAE